MVVSVWLELIPAWITTLAVGVAAYQLSIDRRRRATEEDRESKSQARRISAWAASERGVDGRGVSFGIVISNRSDSTFHDVQISSRMHKTERPDLHLTVLPPGEFYVQLRGDEWEYALATAEYGKFLRPYTGTQHYKVLAIKFTDNLNQKWGADEHMVLVRR